MTGEDGGHELRKVHAGNDDDDDDDDDDRP